MAIGGGVSLQASTPMDIAGESIQAKAPTEVKRPRSLQADDEPMTDVATLTAPPTTSVPPTTTTVAAGGVDTPMHSSDDAAIAAAAISAASSVAESPLLLASFSPQTRTAIAAAHRTLAAEAEADNESVASAQTPRHTAQAHQQLIV